jgi:hypothetical protein
MAKINYSHHFNNILPFYQIQFLNEIRGVLFGNASLPHGQVLLLLMEFTVHPPQRTLRISSCSARNASASATAAWATSTAASAASKMRKISL